MIFDILTIFPNLLDSPLNESIIKRARQECRIRINMINIREFATDKHATTDDRPFGGGEGMVMKPEPLTRALHHTIEANGPGKVILLSPQGKVYNQRLAVELSRLDHIILICGRYEGVDERFRKSNVDEELSIGDYILTGGELAAMIVVDSVTRLLPGVLGCSDSAENDSFSRWLLKHGQYTRPRDFDGLNVPEVLLTGDHDKIASYRFLESVKRTLSRRPDLIAKERFSAAEVKLLKKNGLWTEIKEAGGHE